LIAFSIWICFSIEAQKNISLSTFNEKKMVYATFKEIKDQKSIFFPLTLEKPKRTKKILFLGMTTMPPSGVVTMLFSDKEQSASTLKRILRLKQISPL